jgi:glycogen phosphorylase
MTPAPENPLARLLDDVLLSDVEGLKHAFADHLEHSLAKDTYTATPLDLYKSLVYVVRDRLVERWITTQHTYYMHDVKRIYYVSLEFLMGRSLANNLINLGLEERVRAAVRELGLDFDQLEQLEVDAGLGNGGLGRLAACFLDSMASLELPGYGYGIRYEYGIFFQKIIDGYQVEAPDNWLRFENPWEIARPEYIYPVRYYGQVDEYLEGGRLRHGLRDPQMVMAMAYDTPIPGYRNNTVNTLRLWTAKSSRDFDLSCFNAGDYLRAVEDKRQSEIISKVLYPNDQFYAGLELRLKQEYFLVSATLQDLLRRYKKRHASLRELPDKVAIQLNDTHPALAIPELMRLLVDEEGFDWEDAWEMTVGTCGYTNHTVMPEALERWPVSLMHSVLPRLLQIIHEINRRFLDGVGKRFPRDVDRLRRMSLIEEGGEQKVQMAHLAIVGSHAVNGVAALHTELLKHQVFPDFYELYPERFQNKTNGITQRRWLRKCNPALSALISEAIGDAWITNLYELARLRPLAGDSEFRRRWRAVKHSNKERLAALMHAENGIDVDLDSIFDCQIKRMHEYKRQLLNLLHTVALYQYLVDHPDADIVPRTVIFSGKAAPGYASAKLIIKLIHSVGAVVNSDARVGGRLKVVFLANYRVSLAEIIVPAADLSEQISTAGMEASGTGNMKLALNGALTIGTLDGATIEMREEIGAADMFVFGLTAQEVAERRRAGYRPRDIYEHDFVLKRVLDAIAGGFFSPDDPQHFAPVVTSLLEGDRFFVLADFAAYVTCQQEVARRYRDIEDWSARSIRNVAGMGKFSSDRSIREYAADIWRASPQPIELAVGVTAPTRITGLQQTG